MGLKSGSDPTPLLLGNRRTPVPILYWGFIFLVTIIFSFAPLFGFLATIASYQSMSASLLFLGSLVLAGVVVGNLPKSYYRVHAWERSGRLYRGLGVRYFEWLVPNGKGINYFVRKIQSDYRVVRGHQSIDDLEVKTIGAEGFHMSCLIAICPSAIYAIFQGWTVYIVMLTLPNIPLHVYPILLQRSTRARIARLRRRLDRATAG